MTTYPNAFITPVYQRLEKGDHGAFEVVSQGQPLTKREYFAAMAIQGFCANEDWYKRSNGTATWYSHKAVEIADALIEELNK
jgi:hypothetical protein